MVPKSIISLLHPPTCTARTIAILLHFYCVIYDAPPTPLLYALLAYTRYCHYQYGIVYGITREGRGGVVYCAQVAQ